MVDISEVMKKILVDKKANGKARPWYKNKVGSVMLANVFDALDEDKKATRLILCGSKLDFKECILDHKNLKYAKFCRQRLCPMCIWRKSLLVSRQVRLVSHELLKREPKYSFLLLTLTVPNVEGDQLDDEITHIMESFHRLSLRKEFRVSVKGYFRKLEITYNFKTKEYHPHLHILLVVPTNYFTKDYIKRDRWLELWRESARNFNITQVDIRKVEAKKNMKNKTLEGAVAEVSKYLMKMLDIFDGRSFEEQKKIISVLEVSLRGRRLHQYGGILKKIHKELNLVKPEEAENSDLIGDNVAECLCKICENPTFEISYFWSKENYYAKDEILIAA